MFTYRITVTINGKYYFHTEPRGASREDAIEIAAQLAARFPEAEVELSEWTVPVGKPIELNL